MTAAGDLQNAADDILQCRQFGWKQDFRNQVQQIKENHITSERSDGTQGGSMEFWISARREGPPGSLFCSAAAGASAACRLCFLPDKCILFIPFSPIPCGSRNIAVGSYSEGTNRKEEAEDTFLQEKPRVFHRKQMKDKAGEINRADIIAEGQHQFGFPS